MTDNEIIKALDICGHIEACEDCPLDDLGDVDKCVHTLMLNALDLINRQKAEKEALIAGQETLQKYIAEQKAEIERLKYNLKAVLDERADHSEAIKEFVDRLDCLAEIYDGSNGMVWKKYVSIDRAKELAKKMDQSQK